MCKSFCVLLLLKEGSYLLSYILYIGILVVIGLNLLCVTEVSQTLFHLVWVGWCCLGRVVSRIEEFRKYAWVRKIVPASMVGRRRELKGV